ncbi:MAG: hypothetical protein ABI761_19080 [Saprospiraceae bacterium]
MKKIFFILFAFLFLSRCTDESKIRIPAIADGVNLRIIIDPAHTGIFTDKITTDFLAFDMHSINKDFQSVELFATKAGVRKTMKTFTQADFDASGGKVHVEFKASDFAQAFNEPGLGDGSKVGNFTFSPRVTLNDGRVYPSFVKFSATDSVLNLAPSINGAPATSFTSVFQSFITCPAVDISGNYLVTEAKGLSTDGCCPTVVTISGTIVKVTRVTSSSFKLSDFSGGLYFEWYDVYGIEKPEDSPGEISFSCNEINIQNTLEPFGEVVHGTGNYDPNVKTLVYEWVNGYGDKATVKMTKQ